jgi:UDP-glucose 4-epimerase
MSGSILITGGFGNLGSWLSEYFCKAGYDVTILSHHEHKALPNLSYQTILADITNLNTLKNVLTQNYDYCLHTASHNDFFVDNYEQQALMVNALGTRNLLEVLHDKINKHFIYFSTFHVYGKSSGKIDEQTIASPKNDYASTHLFGETYIEQFVQTKQFPASVIRLTNSYGAPKQMNATKWYLILNDLSRMAYEKKQLTLLSNGNPTRDFIAMADVCQIIEKMLPLEAIGEKYNISGQNCITMLEIAQKVQQTYQNRHQSNLDITINTDDTSTSQSLYIDSTKLYSQINFQPTQRFEDEINSIFDLLENNG